MNEVTDDPAASRRAILEMVASGELSPEEAVLRLGESEGPHFPDPPQEFEDLPPAWESMPDPVPGEGRAKRIEVRAALRSVVIEGDHEVAEASPAGSHRAFRDGDTLVISAEP